MPFFVIFFFFDFLVIHCSTEDRTMFPDNESNKRPRQTEKPAGTPTNRSKSAKYNDETADVELVSSDNVVFKVHSYYLKSAR